jgi:hypothetical protein
LHLLAVFTVSLTPSCRSKSSKAGSSGDGRALLHLEATRDAYSVLRLKQHLRGSFDTDSTHRYLAGASLSGPGFYVRLL